MKRIYLACPYSDEDKAIRANRALQASIISAKLMQIGDLVYSPITHGHELCSVCDLPVDFEFWQRHCLSFLENWASDLYVLTLDNWQNSKGVQAEIEFAKSRDINISYI